MSEVLAKDGIHSIEEIAPKTYRIDERGIVNCYLLLGEKKALLIDSGVGVGELPLVLKSLTDLPITLALTHRHCDHAGGINYFTSYYVHEGDKPFIYGVLSGKLACNTLLKKNNITDLKLSKKPYHAKAIWMKDGQSFDLGGRIITVLSVPGHTAGSVVYLDPQTNLMFTGDDVNSYLWLQLPGCATLSTWLVGAKKIANLTDKYQAYGGHEKGRLSAENIHKTIALGEEMLAKKDSFTDKTVDYPSDKNVFPRILITKKGIR